VQLALKDQPGRINRSRRKHQRRRRPRHDRDAGRADADRHSGCQAEGRVQPGRRRRQHPRDVRPCLPSSRRSRLPRRARGAGSAPTRSTSGSRNRDLPGRTGERPDRLQGTHRPSPGQGREGGLGAKACNPKACLRRRARARRVLCGDRSQVAALPAPWSSPPPHAKPWSPS
jgi:hypothetical protein